MASDKESCVMAASNPSTPSPASLGTNSRKRSKVWLYFSEDEANEKFAVCHTCKTRVSRGNVSAHKATTTNMVSHLRQHHIKEYKEFSGETEQSNIKKNKRCETEIEVTLAEEQSPNQVNQPTILKFFKKWPIHHPRAEVIHRRIGELIAMHNHPFSLVEQESFIRLIDVLEPQYQVPSRKFITEYLTQTMHDRVLGAMRNKLLHITGEIEVESNKEGNPGQFSVNKNKISLTSDGWTANNSPGVSMLSLTGHWIDTEFNKIDIVLNVVKLEDSHTGQYLASKIEECLAFWKIPKNSVHLMLRDNAANMKRACEIAEIESRGCVDHTYQLVIKTALLSQRAVIDALAICRSIVGHFKHSTKASALFEKYQLESACPPHRLIQDEPTRWNSTFYMVQRLSEQKRAVVSYTSDHEALSSLSSNQWGLLEKLVTILSPFEEATRQLSSDTGSVGDVIPCVKLVKRALEKFTDDSGLKTMKEELLKEMGNRFCDIENDKFYVLATVLDPRYKLSFLSSDLVKESAKVMLIKEGKKLQHLEVTEVVNVTKQPAIVSTCEKKTYLFDNFD